MFELNYSNVYSENQSFVKLTKIIFTNTLKLGFYIIKYNYTNIYFRIKVKLDYINILFNNKNLI